MILLSLFAHAVLQVGPNKPFADIGSAVRAASAGDTIEVTSAASGYSQVAVTIDKPGLKIIGLGEHPIALNGLHFDYSGVGATPRAIFQINPSGAGSVIENFELSGAHNDSHNGAGVRINGAANVTIEKCDIHNNDMGIMSAGAGAANQVIQRCHIHSNGDQSDPGYNHNLYLGGDSVTVRFCEIDHALTGHDLKSRAHYNLVEYCFLHDSANRECDFVEADETVTPDSNAVLIGNEIDKMPTHGLGNGTVIQFGREKGERNGTLYLINNSIGTSSIAPVVLLSSPKAGAVLLNNVILNDAQARPVLLAAINGADAMNARGAGNVLSKAFSVEGTAIKPSGAPVPADYVDGKGERVKASLEFRYAGGNNWKSWSGGLIAGN